MLRVFCVVLTSSVLVASWAQAQTAPGSDQELRNSLQAIIDQWEDAFRRQDASAIASLFVEDGDLVTPQGHYSGREAIKGALMTAFNNGFTSQEIEIAKVRSIGTGAFGFGQSTASGVAPQTSAPVKLTARWTGLYEFSSSGWRILHLATTPVPQPPAR